jgi:hypothetical protein
MHHYSWYFRFKFDNFGWVDGNLRPVDSPSPKSTERLSKVVNAGFSERCAQILAMV